jgi:hypothetical protein
VGAACAKVKFGAKQNRDLSLSEIKSEHTDGVIRRELVLEECVRWPEQPAASDKSTTPYMAMTELCARFGIAPSTGGNKAKLVRKALGIRQFDHKWTLPSRLADSSLPWLIAVDGLVVDARRLPVAIQEVAVQKGLIPYLNPRPEEDTA